MSNKRKRSDSNGALSARAAVAGLPHPRRSLASHSYAEPSTSDSNDVSNDELDDEPVVSRRGRGLRNTSASRRVSYNEEDDEEEDGQYEPDGKHSDEIDTRTSKKAPANYKHSTNDYDEDDNDSPNEENESDFEPVSKRRISSTTANNKPSNGISSSVNTRSRSRVAINDDEDEDEQIPVPVNETETYIPNNENNEDTNQAAINPDDTLEELNIAQNDENEDGFDTHSTTSLTVKLKIGTESAHEISTKEKLRTRSNVDYSEISPKKPRTSKPVYDEEDEDDDDKIVSSRRRTRTRTRNVPKQVNNSEDEEYQESEEESSEPASEGEEVRSHNISDDDDFIVSDDEFGAPRKRRRKTTRQSRQPTRRTRNSRRSAHFLDNEDDDFHITGESRGDNLPRRKHLRERKYVNYQILPPPPIDEPINEPVRAGPAGSAAGARGRRAAPIKRLFPTGGPFGGNDLLSVFGSSEGSKPALIGAGGHAPTAAGGVADSETDDDELRKPENSGPRSSISRGKATALSDSDPLGVDMNIDFSAVGGLDHYVNQLKEMVYLPLMYPEVYKRFGITPPRGVLFHGPPGTGKTLMARALAASFSTDNRKVTFFMRKGADCLSKWVGEAERQLRLLFEEAKNKQPSIIFFDEIDGLAPVRSSKQEQIHASIVSTLLALMDGMDNRGQVIVIGATNRPDSVDPALRRPGRFDREFYFPLPDLDARKQIVTIHTKKWNPPLETKFVEHIARVTKGYGGADLRALCTEAALSAIQRRYPQIYQSSTKLLIDPSTIQVSARDFLRAVDRIIPSSTRSTSSLASPLPKHVEPLLFDTLKSVKAKLDLIIPRNKKLPPLEDALYEDAAVALEEVDGVPTDLGFAKQEELKEFQASRVFRPRLLIHGKSGMGQQYLGSAALHHLEGYHIQPFDLGTLFSDSTHTPEAMMIQLLVEVKRHTPSVIFIPNIDTWFSTLSPAAISTFFAFLRNLNPTDAILVLGILEADVDISEIDPVIQSLFGYSSENLQSIRDIDEAGREAFFETLIRYIRTKPIDFPENRKKRKLEELPEAPKEPEKVLSEAEGQKRARMDLQLANKLKIKLNTIMELLRRGYKRFRKPIIDDTDLLHLYEPNIAALIPNPPYIKTDDDMILEVSTNKKYFNMDLDVIEERLWNGFYLEPKQFLKDVRMVHTDCITSEDRERILKASEMLTNVEVYLDDIGVKEPQFINDCHEMYTRKKLEARKLAEGAAASLQEEQLKLETENTMPLDPDRQMDGSAPGDIQFRTNTTQLVTAMAIDGSLSVEKVKGPATLEQGALSLETPIYNSSEVNNEYNPGFSSIEGNTNGTVLDSANTYASIPNGGPLNLHNGDSHLNGFYHHHQNGSSSLNGQSASPISGPVEVLTSPKSIVPKSLPDSAGFSHLSALSPVPVDAKDVLSSNGSSSDHLTTSSSNIDATVPTDVVSETKPVRTPSPSPPPEPLPDFVLDEDKLSAFTSRLISESSDLTVEQLEQLSSTLTDTVWQARLTWDKTKLIGDLDKCLSTVLRSINKQREKQRELEDLRNALVTARGTNGSSSDFYR